MAAHAYISSGQSMAQSSRCAEATARISAAPLVALGCGPSDLAKYLSEMTLVGEAQRHRDLRDRHTLCGEQPSAFRHALAKQVMVGRHAEGILEEQGEI